MNFCPPPGLALYPEACRVSPLRHVCQRREHELVSPNATPRFVAASISFASLMRFLDDSRRRSNSSESFRALTRQPRLEHQDRP